MSGDCLNNIPYASVVGCIFCLVGAGVMGGTMWEALRLTNERIFGLFLIRLEWLQYVQYGVISLCGFVTLIALLLIVFGYLATKATRQHMYREDVCTMGGRCTACCCLSITYLLSVIWVLLFAVLGLPVVFWLMVTSVCFHNKQPSNYTFNLRHYGIYESMLPASAVVSVSGNTFGELCQAADYIGPLYGASFAGAFMVVFGLCALVSAIACLRMRLKFSKEFVALKQGCDEQTADELQSFLVQNARAGISAGAGAYQLQPVTSGSLLAAPQNQLQRASAQQQSQSHFQGYSLPPANNPYAEPVRDSRTQFDRTKAASPTAQFDSRNQSKSATMQFDQRSIQQAQYDQRSIPQYDTRNQQFTGNAYVQSSGPSQSGSVNQLSMQLQGANNAMINASANNQAGLMNMTNYYTSMGRGGGAARDSNMMQGGPLPSYNTAVHGAYLGANAGMQLGLHDMNAYQLAGNDMNATGASLEEEDADAEWNMQMNTNVLKQ